jgi:hypothetical protein
VSVDEFAVIGVTDGYNIGETIVMAPNPPDQLMMKNVFNLVMVERSEHVSF